ncbi:MAG: ABC transporter permease [Pseudomonadota bacterium]
MPTILFPAMLYAFFGAQSGGGSLAAQATASCAVYAVFGVGFFQFGVTVAQDRESPFATCQRSLSGHAANRWAAGILTSFVFVAIAVSLVIAVALFMVPIDLGTTARARLALVCLAAAVPARAMGFALGSMASARAAVPMANLVFLPLAYLGGLWVPPMAMSKTIAAISEWTPTRAMGVLGWAATRGAAFDPRHLGLLAARNLFEAGVIALARQVHRRRG